MITHPLFERSRRHARCPSVSGFSSRKVALFIKANWQKIMAYIVTLSLIVVIMGGMHGFKKIAKPFSIGIAIGIGFGILVSTVTWLFYKHKSKSGWQLFRNGIVRRLDQGMSTLFFSISATLILYAIPFFPYIGAFIGLLLMNHLCIQLMTGNTNDPALPQVVERVEQIEEVLGDLVIPALTSPPSLTEPIPQQAAHLGG